MERDDEIIRQRAHAKAVNSPISSGFTPETLKQAMDDAKAVRQQALANAKQALEEAFGDRFKQMFDQKLAEELRQDERNPKRES